MPKKVTHQQLEAILKDCHSLNIKQLAQKYSFSRATITKILKSHGIKPLKKTSIIPMEVLMELLKDGWLSVEEMSRQCNTSYYTVNKSLRAHGVIRGRKPTVRNRIREGNRAFKVLGYLMANPEMTLEAIAKQFLCTREFVSQVESMARNEGIIK